MSLLVFVLVYGVIKSGKDSMLLVDAKLDWKHTVSTASQTSYHDLKLRMHEQRRGSIFEASDRHIPALGVGLNNDPYSLLMRLFYSFDYPIDKAIVVTGTAVDRHVQYELDHIIRHFNNVVIKQAQGAWLGVAETWNMISREVPDAPWMVIVSADIEFTPGALERLANRAWEDYDRKEADHAIIEYSHQEHSIYSAFVLFRSGIAKLGLFDENIFPAYYEDSEFELRRKLYEATGRVFHSKKYHDVVAFHGLPTESGNISQRLGVINYMTQQHSAVPKEKILEVIGKFTVPYLRLKWGCAFNTTDWERSCTFSSPYNGSHKVSYWIFDDSRRAQIMNLLLNGSKLNGSEVGKESLSEDLKERIHLKEWWLQLIMALAMSVVLMFLCVLRVAVRKH